jgi:two-component sensor histidine kinase
MYSSLKTTKPYTPDITLTSEEGISNTAYERIAGINGVKRAYGRMFGYVNATFDAARLSDEYKADIGSIEVKDNGIGIPQDKLNLIFERFGQVDSSLSRQAEGAGIGLSLVKRFVESLGGSISVKSKVSEGSTFSILLPNEKVLAEHNENRMTNLMDNHLVQITTVEFSDIYL